MSALSLRGGVPSVFRLTTSVTVRHHRFAHVINHMVARNQGADIIRLYFTGDDAVADANYVELPVAAATDPHGEWAGPVEIREIWIKAAANTPVLELVSFQRRG